MRFFANVAILPAAAALSLGLACAAAAAQATPTGALRPCAVLSAGVSIEGTYMLVGFRELTQEVYKGLVLGLHREDSMVRPAFVDTEEAKQNSAKALAAMKEARCRLLIQVQGVLEEGLEVHFDLSAWPATLDAAGTVALAREPAFKKSYAPPDDAEAIKSRDFKTFGDSMAKDLAAAGLLTPIRGADIEPARVRAEYDRIVAQMSIEPEVHLRHLVVKSESEARAALKRVREGTPFADVARQVTLDPGSKDKGGDLGWSVASGYDKDFAMAVAAAGSQTGLLADVVRTQYGWHVVELLGQRPQQPPAFEQVQRNVMVRLRWQDMEAAAARSSGS